MSPQTYHDLNHTLRKLADAIRSHRYAGDRGGIIPPDAIADALTDVRDACATIALLTDDVATLPHA